MPSASLRLLAAFWFGYVYVHFCGRVGVPSFDQGKLVGNATCRNPQLVGDSALPDLLQRQAVNQLLGNNIFGGSEGLHFAGFLLRRHSKIAVAMVLKGSVLHKLLGNLWGIAACRRKASGLKPIYVQDRIAVVWH